jgi:hypothetical protein
LPSFTGTNCAFDQQGKHRRMRRYPKQRWPGRIVQAIAVNCGISDNCHRAAASARAFSLMLPSHDRWSALPGRPDFSSDKKVTPLEECATRTSGRRMHTYVKGCDSVPRGNFLSVGATLGSGARCPKPQSPHVLYCRKSLSASFGSSSFPVREQCTPTFTRRQCLLFTTTKPKFSPFPRDFSERSASRMEALSADRREGATATKPPGIIIGGNQFGGELAHLISIHLDRGQPASSLRLDRCRGRSRQRCAEFVGEEPQRSRPRSSDSVAR